MNAPDRMAPQARALRLWQGARRTSIRSGLRWIPAALAWVLGFPCGTPSPAMAQAVDESFPVTDGPVTGLLRWENTLYVRGDYSHIGPVTGCGVPLSATTSRPLPPFPKITGKVSAVVGDGVGGWYVGGHFDTIGEVSRANLAHILSDGTVAEWNPGTDRPVKALALSGNLLYVGGEFNHAGGQPRNYLAALDATTGLATDWNPNATDLVLAIVVDGPTVYVGGEFWAVGGQDRNFIAALDAATGMATAWNPDAGLTVLALLVRDNLVYAGGFFRTIGGQARKHLAAIDKTTGQVTAWSPDPGGYVRALAIRGSTLYAGGEFSTLAAIDVTTGTRSIWAPGFSGWVLALAVSGNTVYAGGTFRDPDWRVFDRPSRVAAFDAATGQLTAWNPIANGDVLALGLQGDAVYVGGTYTSIGGRYRSGFAALNAATGEVTPWNPAGGAGRIMAMHRGKIFITKSPEGVGALDPVTGQWTNWQPDPPVAGVNALAFGPGVVYVGGSFVRDGRQIYNRIGAFDDSTGAATGWNPDANGTVMALAAADGIVYAGGKFGIIGGQERLWLAALDATTGLATAWNPDPRPDAYESDGYVNVIARFGELVYVGGDFQTIGGRHMPNFAMVDAATGQADPWSVSLGGDIAPLVMQDGILYMGGDFQGVGGVQRPYLLALQAATGRLTPWCPGPDRSVLAVAAGPGRVYAGGYFYSIGGVARTYLAAVSACLVSCFAAQPVGGSVVLTWSATQEVPAERCRLTATLGANSWDVPIAPASGVAFEARDDSPFLHAGGRVAYELELQDEAGLWSQQALETVLLAPAPYLASLGVPRPNPFNAQVTIPVLLDRAQTIRVAVYDLAGREVTRLPEDWLADGQHEVAWDGRDRHGRPAQSGAYFVRLVALDGVQTRKVMLLK